MTDTSMKATIEDSFQNACKKEYKDYMIQVSEVKEVKGRYLLDAVCFQPPKSAAITIVF